MANLHEEKFDDAIPQQIAQPRRLKHVAALFVEVVLVIGTAAILLMPGVLAYWHSGTATSLPSSLPKNWNALVSADDKLNVRLSADSAFTALLNSKIWRVARVRNDTYRTLTVRVIRGTSKSTTYLAAYEGRVFWSEDTEIEIEIPIDEYGYYWRRYNLPVFISVDKRPTEQQAPVSTIRQDAYGRRSVVK